MGKGSFCDKGEHDVKDYARGFYQSRAWRTTQAAYMASQHYVCERCGSLARIVHHVRHITPQNINDMAVTLDWANLEALCMECHNAEHMSSEGISGGLRFDHEGNITAGA